MPWPEGIVLAHNYYGSEAPSGENLVVDAERDLLRARGHRVTEFSRRSDDVRAQGALGLARAALATPWNPFARRRLSAVVERERPAILHVHNTFPLISPAAFRAARGLPVATVLTLHNYRLFCAAAVLLREGRVCTECLDRASVLPALRYGCYRGSRAATAPLAASIALHRALGTYTDHVDAFVVFTAFQREVVVRAGLPAGRVHIRPQFHPSPPAPLPWAAREGAVYVGRLSPEKGVPVLLEAWRRLGPSAPPLVIAGDGSDRERLEGLVREWGLSSAVRFVGNVPPAEAVRLLGRSRLLVVPSLCYEGFPLVVRDALAAGVPVAASRIGALASIVEEGRGGLLFDPGDAGALAELVRDAFGAPARLAELGAGARRAFEERLTAEAGYDSLVAVYRAAAENRRRRAA